jgi:short-subunit dehydrogenase
MKPPVCVVIGAGEGIAQAVAQKFGKAGYTLAMLARNREKLSALVDKLHDQHLTVSGHPCDVAHFPWLESTLHEVGKELGTIEVVVYNAAEMTVGNVLEQEAEAFAHAFRVNAAGAVAAIRQVVPAMEKHGRGTILLTGGGFALFPEYGWEAISLSVGKAAVRSLAFGLHGEMKKRGIHVGTVTVMGTVGRGTPFDPDLIAEAFWELHAQEPGAWTAEIIYEGRRATVGVITVETRRASQMTDHAALLQS